MHGLHSFNISFGYMLYLGAVTLYPMAGGHYLQPVTLIWSCLAHGFCTQLD